MSDRMRELTHTEFYMRENSMVHTPVENEMSFFDSIKRGDMEEVNRLFTPLGGDGYGILSADELTNLKYHLIITIAFITRFCVEGGMERETAYNLSDIYIRQADKARFIEQIHVLHKNAVLDFTERMAAIRRKKGMMYSKTVVDCFEYVYNHLNEKILLSDIAYDVGLSVSYLSELFHSETGMTIAAYILKKRLETAARMLIYSDYEAADIAQYLAFSSHSHFISQFKKAYGCTPRQYRSRHYHSVEGIKGGAKIVTPQNTENLE